MNKKNMSKLFKNKGFTIIELIVVIAIIAVLAAIVLVNVTQYINKGKDSAIKGNLANALTSAAIYFESNPTGAGLCVDPGFLVSYNAADSANGTGTVSCADSAPSGSASNWCACAQLVSDTTQYYCVDATGKKAQTTASCATDCADGTDYVCDGA